MTRAADLCVKSAREHGADSALIWTQDALKKTEFYRENKALLDQPRGCGFWSFKPFVLSQEMQGLSNGQFIIWADAGIQIINNLHYVIDRMEPGCDLWAYSNEWNHCDWTKRDVIDSVWPGSQWSDYGKQAQASVLFIRISDYTRGLVAEWLKWCLFEGGRLIDDSPSRAANHEGFREHRHDQSIFSTLLYREKIAMRQWAVKYLTFEPMRAPGYPADDDLPVLYLHHRCRDANWHEYESRTQCL